MAITLGTRGEDGHNLVRDLTKYKENHAKIKWGRKTTGKTCEHCGRTVYSDLDERVRCSKCGTPYSS